MCAGVTTYNSLRHSPAKPGDTVAIVGLGGLGHLGVQFSAKMGFNTVAVSRGSEKKDIALKLGAHHYIDTSKDDVKTELLKFGGAKVVLWTATTPQGFSDYLNALDLDGQILVVAVLQEPMPILSLPLIGRNSSIKGWAGGDAQDSLDTLEFAALTGVRPLIEKFPFSKAQEAFDRMSSTKAQFRVVLEGWE